MVLKMPLYIFDGVDLEMYLSEENLANSLEEQDVERGMDRCFDSDGFTVLLYVVKDKKDSTIKTFKGPQCIPEYTESLRRSLSAVGVSLNEELTLSDLQNLAKSTFDTY